jgi:hypothetical protein
MLSILYANGGLVALYVKGVVAATKDGIGPLIEVEAFKTMVAWTGDDGLGGQTPPVVTTIVGIGEFSEEVAAFVSIVVCDIVWHS